MTVPKSLHGIRSEDHSVGETIRDHPFKAVGLGGKSGKGGGLQEIHEQRRRKLVLHPGGFPRGPGAEQEE